MKFAFQKVLSGAAIVSAAFCHILLLNTFTISAAQAAAYTPLAEQCDGFPKLPIVTAENLCVGLITQKNAANPFLMPRTGVETKDGKLLIADMGGWAPNKGKLWLVDYRAKTPTATALLSGLHAPHKILVGPDGKFFLGETHRIVRFEIVNSAVANMEAVVDDLPSGERYLHPLKNFVFDQKNNLIVNIGSSSDRCSKDVSMENCTNGTEAGLRLYNYNAKTNSWDKNFTVIASGLRNSMALAVDKSGTIIQAENSIDFNSAEEPYEELNVIEGNGFYGWPLCYGRNASMDETQKSCTAKNYHEPWTLLPPHAAPLDALYYHNKKLAALDNKLLLTWHGYRSIGHRLVAFDIDSNGKPIRKNEATYWRDPATRGEEFTQVPFNAKGGTGLVAQHTEIISRWNEVSDVRPKGSPTGISVLNDGSLLIIDDKNAAILRLSTGTAFKDSGKKEEKYAKVELPKNVNDILASRCSKCHEEIHQHPEELLNDSHWLRIAEGKTRLEQKVFLDKAAPMPPDNSLLPEEKKVLREWIDSKK